jgi:hypothetical protein
VLLLPCRCPLLLLLQQLHGAGLSTWQMASLLLLQLLLRLVFVKQTLCWQQRRGRLFIYICPGLRLLLLLLLLLLNKLHLLRSPLLLYWWITLSSISSNSDPSCCCCCCLCL